MKEYNHQKIEKKWQKKWLEEGTYQPDLAGAEKPFYNLMMFPYPSAEGLHVGNMYAFTGADVYGRYQRMQGKDVFEPIGLDGFGIHSENYAIKVGEHPVKQAKLSQKRFYNQLSQIGNGFAWENHLETYDPEYYRWTQWLFVQMFKHGLAYKKPSKVNWCPSCKTVLADEQVEGGVCERCKSETVKKTTEQWFFKITEYADRLLTNIKKIDWPKKIKIAQENWIGKSKGLSIDFGVEGVTKPVTIWTKFWETVFGTTYLVLAPEHWVIGEMAMPERNKKEVEAYIKQAVNKTEQQRLAGAGEKTGVFTGVFAVNPVNGERVPVWVADYVLLDVGTGAVMGVPAHDERDFAFARKYKLGIRKVVDVESETHSLVMKKSVRAGFLTEVKKHGWYQMDYEGWGWGVVFPAGEEREFCVLMQGQFKPGPWYAYTDGAAKLVVFKDKIFKVEGENEQAKAYGKKIGIAEEQLDWNKKDNYRFCHEKGGLLVNSGKFNGLDAWGEGKEKMAEWMIEKGFGRWETTYHLRDWIISRQRYWGAPIPMVNCKKCGWQAVPEDKLPVLLPKIEEYKPSGDGKSPLEKAPDSWLFTKCPKCGGRAKREGDVSDTFLDSSWYFLRYPGIGLNGEIPQQSGSSHSARIVRDDKACLKSVQALSSSKEDRLPWDREITKKWLPVNAYIGGAEHAVLHLLYSRFVTMALHDWGYLEFEEPFPFLFSHGLIIKDGAKMSKSRGNVVIPDSYIKKYGADTMRAYLMFLGPYNQGGDFRDSGIAGMHRFLKRVWKLCIAYELLDKDDLRTAESKMHKTIKKVTEDIGGFRYNTAISALMEYVNLLSEIAEEQGKLLKREIETLVLLMAPFAPHMAEEIWVGILGNKFSVHKASWPEFDNTKTKDAEVEIVVQVNGKIRGKLRVASELSGRREEMVALAKNEPGVVRHLEGKKIKNTVFVPGKLVNFVV